MDYWYNKEIVLDQSGISQEKYVQKSWGHEWHIINFELYCMKELVIKKGKSTSIHFHSKKHETILVTKGRLLVEIFNKDSLQETVVLNAEVPHERAIIIAPFLIHKLTAIEEDCYLIEASTFSEDKDSIRIKE